MTDWKDRVFQHWDTITTLSVRRFGATALAEEAALAALDGLSSDNWRRLRKYKGEASFKGYLSVLVCRLFEDFARKRFGRIRPPAWVAALGGIWPKLFLALCLERLGLQWAIEAVHQQQETESIDEIEEAAYTILARIPDCGTNTGETELSEKKEAELSLARPLDSYSYEEKKVQEFIENICAAICGERAEIDGSRLLSQYSQLQITLTAEERLLLKLHFQDGLNVTEAGRMLSLNRFQAHGRLKRLMKKLRTEFDRVGLGDEIRKILR